ncbi:MAG: response regulator [Steroidobacteraceae bacterium]|jgi:DNA-binding NtrC family response regulator
MVEPVETPARDPTDGRPVVLIVEDEFLLRWPASEYLRDSGYRVIEASTVSEAIVVFSSHTHIDLVFSDINLQGELTGHALARWLSKHYPAVPMLLTSGDRGAVQSVSTGPTRWFVPKPYLLTDIEQRIKDILSHHV